MNMFVDEIQPVRVFLKALTGIQGIVKARLERDTDESENM
jgi:hypothetical protein